MTRSVATLKVNRVGVGGGIWAWFCALRLCICGGVGLMAAADPEAMAQPGSHILLTVLGIHAKQSLYSLGDQTVKAPLAPLALIQLLPEAERPDTVVALCTPEALQDSWPILEQDLPSGCSARPVEVPSGHSQQDIQLFLQKATEAIPGSSASQQQLSLDVTHGFRHFSFLTYLAGLYLVSLRSVALKGAWYGLLQYDAASPFLDLKPLLALPRWIHALQVLKETGSALPIADALRADNAGQQAQAMARALGQISESYLSALPLELGRQVHLFRSEKLKPMRKQLIQSHQLPLAAELVGSMDQLLQPYALSDPPQGSGDKNWKKAIPLTRAELQRQAHIIDALFAHQDDAMALGLLNEWTVSWALWCLNPACDWLNFHSNRRMAASQIGAIAAACQNGSLKALLNTEQQALGEFWHLLTNLRNGFHHHGMRREELVGNPKIREELAKVKTYWHTTLKAIPTLSLRLGDGESGTLLVTPIGNRPGVLFSALLACRRQCGSDPSGCLVICSDHSQVLISEAAERAGFTGVIAPLLLQDPYGGLQEFPRLRQEAQQPFLRATELLVNVTGGTTLMGLAAQDLCDLARSFARPVRRFGLIDRRSPNEQTADPYQLGEPFWLEGQAEADD